MFLPLIAFAIYLGAEATNTTISSNNLSMGEATVVGMIPASVLAILAAIIRIIQLYQDRTRAARNIRNRNATQTHHSSI